MRKQFYEIIHQWDADNLTADEFYKKAARLFINKVSPNNNCVECGEILKSAWADHCHICFFKIDENKNLKLK